MVVFFLMNTFRLYPGSKLSFEHNSFGENLFLCACFCWDSSLSTSEIDRELRFVGTIAYSDSYLEFFFRHFKVFTLDAILQDAAGEVNTHSGKSQGYCYMIGRGPSSSLLGYVTGLLFCL